jgi:cell division protein FtsL
MSIYTSNYISGSRVRKLRFFRRAGAYTFGVIVCMLLVLYVWQRVNVIRVGYEVEHLKKEKARLVKLNDMLKIEVATLSAPARIERIATSRLGMRTPDDMQVVLVKRIDRVPGAATDDTRHATKDGDTPGRS